MTTNQTNAQNAFLDRKLAVYLLFFGMILVPGIVVLALPITVPPYNYYEDSRSVNLAIGPMIAGASAFYVALISLHIGCTRGLPVKVQVVVCAGLAIMLAAVVVTESLLHMRNSDYFIPVAMGCILGLPVLYAFTLGALTDTPNNKPTAR